MKFRHVHSSSKFNRSPESLHRAYVGYTQKSDLVTFTEVEFEPREKALRVKGWGVITGDESNRNDCGICFDESKFSVEHSEQFLVKDSSYAKSPGGRKTDPLYATIAVLGSDSGSLVLAVVHTPSSVEGNIFSKNKVARTIVWFRTARSVKRRVNTLRKKHSATAAMVVADWNVNFKKVSVRALFKALYPAWTMGWRDLNIVGGTHTNRVIDATFVKGKIKVISGARLMADDDSSDHRPYTEQLELL